YGLDIPQILLDTGRIYAYVVVCEVLELFLNKIERSSTAQHRCQRHHPQNQLCDCGRHAPKCYSVSCRQWHAQYSKRDCLKTGPEACWQVDTFSGHLTGAQPPQNNMITSRLALLDGIEWAVQSVNLPLGSLRRSPLVAPPYPLDAR